MTGFLKCLHSLQYSVDPLRKIQKQVGDHSDIYLCLFRSIIAVLVTEFKFTIVVDFVRLCTSDLWYIYELLALQKRARYLVLE